MIALIQRVSEASVSVDGEPVAVIAAGILALVGVQRNDSAAEAERLAERVFGYRIFPDEAGRMNRSLAQTGGQLLAVPQFTLAADTRSGTRAGFSSAAAPEQGALLFDAFVAAALKLGPVNTGRFGANMQVRLANEGPVTFWLETQNARER